MTSLIVLYTIHDDFLKRHSACGLGSCRPKPTCCRHGNPTGFLLTREGLGFRV